MITGTSNTRALVRAIACQAPGVALYTPHVSAEPWAAYHNGTGCDIQLPPTGLPQALRDTQSSFKLACVTGRSLAAAAPPGTPSCLEHHPDMITPHWPDGHIYFFVLPNGASVFAIINHMCFQDPFLPSTPPLRQRLGSLLSRAHFTGALLALPHPPRFFAGHRARRTGKIEQLNESSPYWVDLGSPKEEKNHALDELYQLLRARGVPTVVMPNFPSHQLWNSTLGRLKASQPDGATIKFDTVISKIGNGTRCHVPDCASGIADRSMAHGCPGLPAHAAAVAMRALTTARLDGPRLGTGGNCREWLSWPATRTARETWTPAPPSLWWRESSAEAEPRRDDSSANNANK